jgi:molybdate transport system substrate-binding protein
MERNNLIIIAVAGILLVLLAVYLVSSPSGEVDEKTVITVSAASSLTESFTQIEQEFEAENPDIDVSLNLASSGSLRMQIQGGAPIDVFASASQNHMDILESENMIDTDTRHDFAENSLVMIVPADSGSTISSLEDLTSDEVGKVAIGDPETAPVGKYAKEAMETASLWDDLSGKLVYGENVKQVLVYVENGEVDAGFVYMTDTVAVDEGQIEIVADIPVTTPISYPIAVVSSSEEKDAGGKFVDFVLSDEGGAILEEYGFTVPDGN